MADFDRTESIEKFQNKDPVCLFCKNSLPCPCNPTSGYVALISEKHDDDDEFLFSTSTTTTAAAAAATAVANRHKPQVDTGRK